MSAKRWFIAVVAVVFVLASASFLAFNRADFVRGYVQGELSAQQINFPAAEKMTPEEAALPGMLKYAGQQMTTGEQAKAYAGYIKLHMEESAVEAGVPGATYATNPLRAKSAELKKAKESGADEATIAKMQEEVDSLTALRASQFQGDMLRGTLLNAWGWDMVATYLTYVGWAMAAAASGVAVIGLVVVTVKRRAQRAYVRPVTAGYAHGAAD